MCLFKGIQMKSRFLLFLAAGFLWVGLAFSQVNINTANVDQLDGLKGIGPTKAKAIVDYRQKNGPFKSVDDLQNVPGIGPAYLGVGYSPGGYTNFFFNLGIP